MERIALKEIKVNTGEVKVSSTPAVFTSKGIGSCVVLFIYDPRKKIGGVAHIMLPGTQTSMLTMRKAMFANTAPSYLTSRLVENGADPAHLKAKIIGGGNMFDWADAEGMRNLGMKNIDQVKRELLRQKIYLAAEEIGGNSGKTVRCYTDTGQVHIKNDKAREKVI
jgi:chemotaxis protein CheD